jgi:predicted porin
MLTKSKQLAGAIIGAAAAILCSSGAFAAEGKGSVFGDLRYGLDFSDSEGPVSDAADVGHDLDFRELNSYIGVKGSAGEGGWTAFGAYESYIEGAVISADTSRQRYIGASSPFGTLTYGTMFTEYAKAGLAIDPFYNTSLANATGGVPGSVGLVAGGINAYSLVSFGLSPLLTGDITVNIPLLGVAGGGIQSNQIAYTSPTMFGTTVNAAVFIDEADDSATGAAGGESHDYAAGASFSMMGINAGVQYLQINDEVGFGTFASTPGNLGSGLESNAVRLHGGYAASNFGANLSVERVDHVTVGGGPAPDEEYLFLSGWFGVAKGIRLAGSVGMTNETGFEGTGVQFGVFHDVLENFTCHVGAAFYDLHEDQITGPGPAVDDTYVVAMGASYKFDLGFSSGNR